jgi:hypothetical protein
MVVEMIRKAKFRNMGKIIYQDERYMNDSC